MLGIFLVGHSLEMLTSPVFSETIVPVANIRHSIAWFKRRKWEAALLAFVLAFGAAGRVLALDLETYEDKADRVEVAAETYQAVYD